MPASGYQARHLQRNRVGDSLEKPGTNANPQGLQKPGRTWNEVSILPPLKVIEAIAVACYL